MRQHALPPTVRGSAVYQGKRGALPLSVRHLGSAVQPSNGR
jgi:hypothetical protein